MINLNNHDAYNKKFAKHVASQGLEIAAKMHIGGVKGYDQIGFIEAELLKHYVLSNKELSPNPFLVDVGCGSGRLARYLSEITNLRYLGTDVVGDLLKYTESQIKRPDWRFEQVNDFVIPILDETADIVCFFSVLTHLLHEQSFVYLREAKRVLKSKGFIVFSYLDFADSTNQKVFRQLVSTHDKREVLSIFFDRPAITFWASELMLEIIKFLPGSKPMLEIKKPVRLKNGNVIAGPVSLGQSLCILRKM